MKITEMLMREDFYKINKNTLQEYYTDDGEVKKLYIYPKLNAIVTPKPSKAVRKYLKAEYDVKGNMIKRFAVRCYVSVCLFSRGIMAKETIEIANTATQNSLIYPCNRKYRIFDFEKQIVDVQIKSGFPTEQLYHEIEFRTRKDLPEFVPELVSHNNLGYREHIIDGRSLARIIDGFEGYRQLAYDKLRDYSKQFDKIVTGREYAGDLETKIIKLAVELNIDCEKLLNKLVPVVKGVPKLVTTFSHGDLQAGNIWIENDTDKVYIIDWELWGIRSVFYDKAALFDNLRPNDINCYLAKDITMEEKAVVILEDVIFQLEELASLPGDFGRDKAEKYISKITKWCNDLE